MAQILSDLKLLSPTSFADILIVAYVFYRLALLVRGTRAAQLIKGLVVLLVATTLSSSLHLYTVNWLLKQTMTALVVALPVVFQPELRRALEKLGQGGFFGSRFMPAGAKEGAIEAMVRSVKRLALKKWGALIVWERSTGLEEYLETGVRLDALVSEELLANIFYPGSPLHDGAVIIREGRIAAAACLLPLAGETSLESEFGTRHRAALGISEQSDALAVVVSEETGMVAVAKDGDLTRQVGLEELRLLLEESFKTEASSFSLFRFPGGKNGRA